MFQIMARQSLSSSLLASRTNTQLSVVTGCHSLGKEHSSIGGVLLADLRVTLTDLDERLAVDPPNVYVVNREALLSNACQSSTSPTTIRPKLATAGKTESTVPWR